MTYDIFYNSCKKTRGFFPPSEAPDLSRARLPDGQTEPRGHRGATALAGGRAPPPFRAVKRLEGFSVGLVVWFSLFVLFFCFGFGFGLVFLFCFFVLGLDLV